jgi:hypothetical protein
MKGNKEQPPRDRWMSRVLSHLRKWRARNGRTVRDQMLRGASYSLGSGAVSLLIIWFEARR